MLLFGAGLVGLGVVPSAQGLAKSISPLADSVQGGPQGPPFFLVRQTWRVAPSLALFDSLWWRVG